MIDKIKDYYNLGFLEWAVNYYEIIDIIWNLFLALIPFGIFYLLYFFYKTYGFNNIFKKIIAIILALLWLVFLPNIAYIITDARHISGFCPLINKHRICSENAWMVMFFYLYASIGWVAFVLALNQMKAFIMNIGLTRYAKLYILLIIPISALGVLLGLVDRWNSWDIINNFSGILKTASLYFTDWQYIRNWLFFSLSLYILYYSGNWLIKIRGRKF